MEFGIVYALGLLQIVKRLKHYSKNSKIAKKLPGLLCGLAHNTQGFKDIKLLPIDRGLNIIMKG